jgi:glycosyltransferase involved in cell wall biosynthesis
LIDSRQSLLFLVSELEHGGEGSSARALAHALPSDQFQINIVVLGRSDVEALCASGIAVKRAPIRGMMDVGGARRLRRFVRDCEPDIIHAWGAAAVSAARQLVSSDGMEGNYPRLVLSNASKTGGGFRGWLVARRLRRADRVIPSTRTDGDRYRRIGVPAEQLTLIAPAAPTVQPNANSNSTYRELQIPPGAPMIVAGGRSEAGFGPRDAIIAFDMLRYDLKQHHLAVLGAGDESSSLETLARSLAFDDFRVRIVRQSAGFAAAIRLADAVFVTRPRSGIEDALEAMTAGKAVVGWESGDLAEIVEDKVSGLLVPLGDRAALAASMRAVLENPSYARRLGDAGRMRTVEHFGQARMVEQFARLYRELAPPRRADRS